MNCYMCKDPLENSAYIVSTDSDDLMILCSKCEYIAKEIEGPKCDFCSSKNVSVFYKCSDIHPDIKFTDIKVVSSQDWAACSECEKVIDRKDLNGLIQRCMPMILKLDTEKNTVDFMVSNMRNIYVMFLKQYTGKEQIHGSKLERG